MDGLLVRLDRIQEIDLSDNPIRVDLEMRRRLFFRKPGLAVIDRFSRNGHNLEGDEDDDIDNEEEQG